MFGRVIAIALAALLAIPAAAQEVGSFRDWTLRVDSNPAECFIFAVPSETRNLRDGAEVNVSRSETALSVLYRPSDGAIGQVAFTGGYPLSGEQPVKLVIGDASFELYPGVSGDAAEWAWAIDEAADAQIVAAMRAGVDAEVTGLSRRGTTTIDTFSLLGFTASMQEAMRRCPG